MTDPGLPYEQPVFSHHVRALLARQAQADRDLVGPSYHIRSKGPDDVVPPPRPIDRGKGR